MHITIEWNEETGEGEITQESWDTIIEYFKGELETCPMPISVLDFLVDARWAAEQAYNHVLKNCRKKEIKLTLDGEWETPLELPEHGTIQ